MGRRKMNEWGPFLKTLVQKPRFSVHGFILDEEEPEVTQEYQRLYCQRKSKDPARRKTRFSFARKGSTQHRASMGKRQQSLWVHKHELAREKLRLAPHEHPATENSKGWTAFLTPRAKDALDLVWAKLEQGSRQAPDTTQAIAEISRGFAYSSVRNGEAPCVTPTGRLWIFNRWRWMVGIEKLALQGFPVDDLDFSDLKDS